MIDRSHWIRTAAGIAAIALAPLAIAQPAPTGEGRGTVPWVTGGVGESEQAQMGVLGQEGYNLRLVFAEKGTGAYLSDVHVTVADAAGRVLVDAVTNGPGFFAKVPPGQYKVTAESKGVRQVRTVHATTGNAMQTMTWPAEAGSAAQ